MVTLQSMSPHCLWHIFKVVAALAKPIKVEKPDDPAQFTAAGLGCVPPQRKVNLLCVVILYCSDLAQPINKEAADLGSRDRAQQHQAKEVRSRQGE